MKNVVKEAQGSRVTVINMTGNAFVVINLIEILAIVSIGMYRLLIKVNVHAVVSSQNIRCKYNATTSTVIGIIMIFQIFKPCVQIAMFSKAISIKTI